MFSSQLSALSRKSWRQAAFLNLWLKNYLLDNNYALKL